MLGFITHSGIYRFIKHFCHWAAIPLLLYILVTVAFNVYFWGFVSLFLLHLFGGVLEIKESELMWFFFGSGGLITGCFFLLTISPLGEGILRLRLGLSKIKPHEYQHTYDLFSQAYQLALQAEPGLPRNITLFVNRRAKGVNAFATGRKTICVTRGFIEANLTDSQKVSILLHEFGHLAHHDTIYLQALIAGEFVITAVITIIGVICFVCGLFGELFGGACANGEPKDDSGLAFSLLGLFTWVAGICLTIISFILSKIILKIWTALGNFVYKLAARSHEYQADHFAGTVGYAHALADALTAFDSGADARQPLFALLASSHPPTKKRVARLRRFPRTSVGEESVIGAYEGEVMCEDTSICAHEETTPSHSDEMTPALSDEIIL